MTLLPTAASVPTGGIVALPLQFGGLEAAVETATGPLGLLIIAAYSFLIAIVLPLPSEIVLAAPLNLGLPEIGDLALIVLVSGVGKAAGSVVAFRLGHEAKRQSGPVLDRLRDSRFDIVEWSERRTVQLAREYGYIGLAIALTVPFFPDTLSIYAFTVLEENYTKFAAATFVGSAGRLILVAGVLAPFFAGVGL
ncbi:YqaA family protein [Halococcus sediminicola]|uniref:YqaA family protein n=1 Tax=Halococcus sediminicola TaxID=1264579 RepID=UPI0006796A6F